MHDGGLGVLGGARKQIDPDPVLEDGGRKEQDPVSLSVWKVGRSPDGPGEFRRDKVLWLFED